MMITDKMGGSMYSCIYSTGGGVNGKRKQSPYRSCGVTYITVYVHMCIR